MTRLGLPVPPGFTITTDACREYREAGRLPAGLIESVAEHLRDLEGFTGKRLGDPEDPLLVSVRSGAAVSMPGMMDTVLNRSEEHTSELQSRQYLVCRLLLEKKKEKHR